MVSTNNVQITLTMARSKVFSRNYPTLLLIKKKLSTDATGSFLWKKPFVRILQYSQENNCVEVSFE